MSRSLAGVTIGAVLALTWLTFGFWAFIFVGFAMAVGYFVARIIDGTLNVRHIADAFRGKRSSS